MRISKALVTAVLGAGLIAGLGVAQPRRAGLGPGRDVGAGALKEYLGLSDAQVQQIREIAKQQAEGVKPIADQMREKANALREEMKKESPDQAKVGQLSVDLKNLREQMKSKRAARGDSISAILTPEQRTKLKALEEAAKLGPAVRQAAALGLIDLGLSPETERAIGQAMRMRAERGKAMRERLRGGRIY
jgi:Spy/CpxP family protein refolding chaperone